MSEPVVTPLTPQAWNGLPLQGFQLAGNERLFDQHVPVAALVFWVAGGTSVDIHRTTRQHWHFRSQANHFDLYAPGEYSAVLTDTAPIRKVVAYLSPQLIGSLMGDCADEFRFENCRIQFADRVLERQLRRLIAHASEGEPLPTLYTQALSVALLTQLAQRTGHKRRDAPAPRLSALARRNLEDLIEDRLSAPPAIAEMALLAGMRSAEFLKAFRTGFGFSPHQYLLERRIERARDLLRLDRSLTAIALDLGFASHAHFSATFRARTGETPSEYRQGRRSAAMP